MNNKFASLGTALSRDEAKKVMGGLLDAPPPGDSCSMTFQNASGQWVTETGTCKVQLTFTPTFSNPWQTTYTSFCSTSSFQSPTSLTSNGGVSRCGATFTA